MSTSGLGQKLVVGIAITCAVVMTGLTVRRELFPAARAVNASPPLEPTEVKDWAKYTSTGHRFGRADAPVTILEFADFECPACRTFTNKLLKSVRERYPDDVSVLFRHWPLSYHRFALPSARAAECAGEQGRFEAFHDALYARQDSLGLRSFEQFARDAGVADLVAFTACNTKTDALASVAADTVAVREIGGRGTPTILVNGLLLPGVPDSARLDGYIQDALKKARSTQ